MHPISDPRTENAKQQKSTKRSAQMLRFAKMLGNKAYKQHRGQDAHEPAPVPVPLTEHGVVLMPRGEGYQYECRQGAQLHILPVPPQELPHAPSAEREGAKGQQCPQVAVPQRRAAVQRGAEQAKDHLTDRPEYARARSLGGKGEHFTQRLTVKVGKGARGGDRHKEKKDPHKRSQKKAPQRLPLHARQRKKAKKHHPCKKQHEPHGLTAPKGEQSAKPCPKRWPRGALFGANAECVGTKQRKKERKYARPGVKLPEKVRGEKYGEQR